MTPQEFQAKGSRVPVIERQTNQEHFRALRALLHQPTESGGGTGLADVWKRGCFGWEYKGGRKDLAAAYTQLLSYKDALENSPLLVVSDTGRVRIHTNVPNTARRTSEIAIVRPRVRRP